MRRPSGDDGVMAVLMCLLLVFVLLPASALAVSSYTRSAVQAEKARSADSAALAGAAALALLDVTAIPTDPLSGVPTEGVAFAKAEAACAKAAAVDNALSDPYATAVSCRAKYSPDTGFAACADDLFDLIPAPVPTVVVVPPPPVPLPGLPPLPIDDGGVIDDILDNGVTVDLRAAAKSLVPALLHNGVTVTLTYKVRGPMDGVFGNPNANRTAVSTARRRFKPLLPPGFGVAGVTVDPEELGVYTALATTLRTLEEAVDSGEPPVTLPVPLPIPVPDPVDLLPASCRPAAVEVIRDLRDALQPNTSETDLLTCVGRKVLGIDPLTPLVGLDDLCASRVFRAQLAPDAP